MDAHIFPWIKDDVAIEIIGKMIAEQVTPLSELLEGFELSGYDLKDEEVISHPDYLKYTQRISELNEEIKQIYRGDNLAEIHKKVDQVYAPYLRRKLSHTSVEF